jgi:septal ring factor EnvC (AmiA/AmiB activator)
MTSSRFLNCTLLLLVFSICISESTVQSADTASNSERKLQRIKQEMQEKKKELKRTKRKEHSVLVDLDKIDRDIQAGSAELASQRRLLRNAEEALQGIEASNSRITRELTGLKRLYGRRLRALYKMHRSGSAVIIAVENPGIAVKQAKYLGLIAEHDRVIIQEYRSALDSLALRQNEITQKKEEILGRQRGIEIKKAELETKRRQKAVILASVRQKKGIYEETLHELEESSAGLWAMIKKEEAERRSAITAHAPDERESKTSGSEKGRLPWPVEGHVLTHFGMQRHPRFGTTVFRRGIEIEAREGQPVRAVSDGEVVYADWYKGYGKLMILDHGNGFYTLYGNLSQLDLNKGALVTKGQIIGLAGETGSLKGAKLYFEIRRNGEAEDPLTMLTKR